MSRRFFIIAVVLVLGCGAMAQEDSISSPKLRIGWEEFKKLYEEKAAVVVDVRDAGSFAAGHIPGARSIPLDEVEKRIPELKKLGKPIVTYCA